MSAVLIVATGGVALAAWSGVGSGNGAATTGNSVALTTAVGTIPTASLLYPGGPAAQLRLTVVNANRFPVSVTALAGNGVVTASGGTGVCTTTGVTLVVPTPGLPIAVPAHVGVMNGSVTVLLTGAVTMSLLSEAGCQGATFTVPVTVTAVSAVP